MDDTLYPLTVFFDASCPICDAEMQSMRRLDAGGRLRFVDASAPGFVAPDGATRAAMLAAIHGRTPDGRWLVGVDTLRAVYAAAGFRRFAAVLGWPGVRTLSRPLYRGLARHRYAIPGRLVSLLARTGLLPAASLHGRCTDGRCGL